MLRSLFSSNMPLNEILILVILILPAMLISLSFHELAHGYVAYKCGDNTAKSLGRLTLNPLKHLDPLGFIMLMLVGFGWAKPVPINSRNFSKPKRDIRLVSIAGPATNLVLALVSHILYRIIIQLTIPSLAAASFLNYSALFYYNSVFELPVVAVTVLIFLSLMVILNTTLCIFNLIPIPPLDGSKILISFLPQKAAFFMYKNERIIGLILIALLLFGLLSGPLSTLLVYIIYGFDRLLTLLPFFG